VGAVVAAGAVAVGGVVPVAGAVIAVGAITVAGVVAAVGAVVTAGVVAVAGVLVVIVDQLRICRRVVLAQLDRLEGVELVVAVIGNGRTEAAGEERHDECEYRGSADHFLVLLRVSSRRTRGRNLSISEATVGRGSETALGVA
jgi:hypothetical protein